MTDETQAAPAAAGTISTAAVYDPARMYRVELSGRVECPPGSGQYLLPGKGRKNNVRGDLVAGLGAALVSARPV